MGKSQRSCQRFSLVCRCPCPCRTWRVPFSRKWTHGYIRRENMSLVHSDQTSNMMARKATRKNLTLVPSSSTLYMMRTNRRKMSMRDGTFDALLESWTVEPSLQSHPNVSEFRTGSLAHILSFLFVSLWVIHHASTRLPYSENKACCYFLFLFHSISYHTSQHVRDCHVMCTSHTLGNELDFSPSKPYDVK